MPCDILGIRMLLSTSCTDSSPAGGRPMILSKYSMGVGDRFGRQGVAQLTAFVEAKAMGVDITPVWNKSNRGHLIVHTHPDSVRAEADAAVKALGWKLWYHVDA